MTEMMSVAEAIRSQLRSLTVTISLTNASRKARGAAAPRRATVQHGTSRPSFQQFAAFAMEILFFICFYHLQYFILFEDQEDQEPCGHNLS